MKSEEINELCREYLASSLSPEDFYNQKAEYQDFTYEECKLLIQLFYELSNIDSRIIKILNVLEETS